MERIAIARAGARHEAAARAASLRFKRGLDVLDHGLKLLVRQVLDRIAVLDLVLARDQQRQNLQICGRLCSAHTFNRLRTAMPEVSEQGRNRQTPDTRRRSME